MNKTFYYIDDFKLCKIDGKYVDEQGGLFFETPREAWNSYLEHLKRILPAKLKVRNSLNKEISDIQTQIIILETDRDY